MREYFPLLFTGAAVGLFSLVFLIAFLSIKDMIAELAKIGLLINLQGINYDVFKGSR